jgi:LMBR1 domain-containing protein 1
MADWFLILATTISFLLLLVVAVYFLVHYQHPDDRNEAWFPKLTVLLGLVLAGATVLLMPLDVANNEGYAGEFHLVFMVSMVAWLMHSSLHISYPKLLQQEQY